MLSLLHRLIKQKNLLHLPRRSRVRSCRHQLGRNLSLAGGLSIAVEIFGCARCDIVFNRGCDVFNARLALGQGLSLLNWEIGDQTDLVDGLVDNLVC